MGNIHRKTIGVFGKMDIKMKKNKKVNNQVKTINISDEADFRLVESYKALRTNLLLSLSLKEGDTKCHRVLLTSSIPGEGKSTTVVNLAITLVQMQARVLIIDADMRKPTVHKYFGLESRLGLSNLLSGMNTKEQCVYSIDNIPGLSVIPAGILPPNPSELLGSNAMKRLLAEFEKDYDYIIIDTPPINVVADALAVVQEVDGVVFVVAQDRTGYPEVSKAMETLRFANANVIGAVLNHSQNDKNKGSYSSKYKYAYYGTQE